MSLLTRIVGGTGRRLEASVSETRNDSNGLHVVVDKISQNVIFPTLQSAIGERFDRALTLDGLGAVESMAIDGSVTPKVFTLLADSTKDIVITDIVVTGVDNGIKIYSTFLAIAVLTNGITFAFKSSDIVGSFRTWTRTYDIDIFSSAGMNLRVESGADSIFAIRNLIPAMIIRAAGTYASDDYLSATVNDNLTAAIDIKIFARGFKIEAGTF